MGTMLFRKRRRRRARWIGAYILLFSGALLAALGAAATAPTISDTTPPATMPATPPAGMPATAPTPRPTTQPANSLFTDIQKAVELAQQSLRARKPPAKPPRNTLDRESTSRPTTDPYSPIAQRLIGKTGVIAFRVRDVAPNDFNHFILDPSAL